jgi:dipeptidyl aminopeptidase/acylaminoacyl peptidase
MTHSKACKLLQGLLALLIALAGMSLLGAEPKSLDLSDLGLLVNLSEPQISPDGHRIAVIASKPDYEENRYSNQLFLVEVSNGARRPLTWSRHGVRNPRWSPDGARIAFIAGDSDKKPQIYVLSLEGGEARQVTKQPEGVVSFKWAPDGKRLAFAGAEKPPDKEGPEKHNKSFEVGGDWYLAEKVSAARHLWITTLEGGKPKRLTNNHTLSYLIGGYSWSPDGQWLVYVGQPDPYSASFLRSSLRRIEVETGEEKMLVEGPGTFANPQVSPTGDLVAYGLPRGEESIFNPIAIRTVASTGGSSRDVSPQIDRDMRNFDWLADGNSILAIAPDGTRVGMWVQPLKGAPVKINLGDAIPESFSISKSGAIAFTATEPNRAPEIYIFPSINTSPRRLTDFNAEVSSRRLGRTETIHWENNGFKEDGVLIYPPDFQQGQRYPLVLTIHGGPMSASSVAFDIRNQIFAACGWLVFSPNYRGSDNLGQSYQRAVVNDAGAGPGRDVMAGIAAVKAKGIVDDERVAVSGWSYGGFMTTWLTAHYQGWKAAVAGASVTDWFDSYTLSDINLWVGYGLGGSPWLNSNDEKYREQSPITYAHRIRTPMLIMSDTLDPRVPVTQSFKLYSVLRDHGVPVHFIAYPVPGHFPTDPVHQRDICRRWIDWIADHFKAGYSSSR